MQNMPSSTDMSMQEQPRIVMQDPNALTAKQLLDLLQSRPEIVVEVKSWFAERLHTAGYPVQEDSITDEILFTRITEDAQLRSAVTVLLRVRGYLTSSNTPAQTRTQTQTSSEENSGNTFIESAPRQGNTNTTTRDSLQDQIRLGPQQSSDDNTLALMMGSLPPLSLSSSTDPNRPLLGPESESTAAGTSTTRSTGTAASSDPFTTRVPAFPMIELPMSTQPSPASQPSTTSRNDARRDNADTEKNPPPADTKQRDDSPQMLHSPAPYNLLALRDLYTQISSQSLPLTRFGADAFQSRGFAAPPSAADLPIGPDYVLGAGDQLTITIWGGVSQTITRIVDSSGKLTVPEAGPVSVAGLRLEQAQELLQRVLTPQFHDAHVEISIARMRTIRVYVVGDVQRPGAYTLNSLATPLNALYAAGGPTHIGSLRTLRQLRGERLISEIDLYDFLLRGIRKPTEHLQDGDTLFVPPAGKQVSVAGAVKRPSVYEISQEHSLAEVLQLAGGVQVSAALGHISVERIVDTHRETLSIAPPNATPEQLGLALATYAVKDGDSINVAPITPWSDRVVYLEGHVVRPGRTPFRDGMSLKDVIASYADLLPEPANRGELIRLMPPDLRPETTEFNLADALSGAAKFELRPYDTIRIAGRYERDAPKVTIRGEVLRPGIYSLSVGMRVSDLVRMAGGFTRSALRAEADLASYDVQDDRMVVSHRETIHVGEAVLHSHTDQDEALKSGDVLTIHQVAGWMDIGASIKIEGEVSYPGTYGLQEGEHLSSVLMRAGGFRSTAYPDGAILLRLQVRVLENKTRLDLIQQIEGSSVGAHLGANFSGQDATGSLQLLVQQQEQMLQNLRNQTPSGRLVINISPDIASWRGTSADIELRAGDELFIPKRPGFVLVSGQVYNASALTFAPGKTAGWYLANAGGPTKLANTAEIFVIRANGDVVGRRSGGWLHGDVLSTRLNAGDVIVVPQKFVGGSMFWRNAMTTAQLFSSIAIPLAIAGL